jgi:hypothetical protein
LRSRTNAKRRLDQDCRQSGVRGHVSTGPAKRGVRCQRTGCSVPAFTRDTD